MSPRISVKRSIRNSQCRSIKVKWKNSIIKCASNTLYVSVIPMDEMAHFDFSKDSLAVSSEAIHSSMKFFIEGVRAYYCYHLK